METITYFWTRRAGVGTRLALTRPMRTIPWAAVGLVLAAAALLPTVFAPERTVSEASDSSSSARPEADDRIKIVHELVRIDVTRPALPFDRRSRPARAKPDRTTAIAAVAATGAKDSGPSNSNPLLRAGRVLTGDGRHRPEPFPSPKR